MTIKAGVLSDTHLTQPDPVFLQRVTRCFQDCDVIIHAGDLTDLSILSAFTGKTVYAVRGNTCNPATRRALPERLVFQLGRFTIGLGHGHFAGADIEDGLWTAFPEADCIVYGHTHRPVCHREGAQDRQGGVLFLNPGAFKFGSYAILTLGESLQAELRNINQTPEGSAFSTS